jgi:Ethylbenzene dehydrogenase
MTDSGRCIVFVLLLAWSSCGGPSPPPAPPATGIPLRSSVTSLSVEASHDDTRVFLHLRWSSGALAAPAFFRFEQGRWVDEVGDFRERAEAGEPPLPLGEVALTIALSGRDGAIAVRDFARAGCFVACHDNSNEMPNWIPSDGHVPMHLLPSFGGPADLWVWGAARSAPARVADDEALSTEGQLADEGDAPSQDLDLTDGAPPFVFDPATAGGVFAQPFAHVLGGAPLAFSDGSLPGPRALPYADAIARGYVPMDGDAVPAQILSRPSASRADVTATSSYDGQTWDLVLVRALSTGDAVNDVALAIGGTYDLAFALHTDGAAGRDHYVSLPVALTLTADGATLDGRDPPLDVPMFLPGVTSYEFLVGAVVTRAGALRANDVSHGGAADVSSGTHACADCHRVRSGDPAPPDEQAGALERLVLRRGGVFGPTPAFEAVP